MPINSRQKGKVGELELAKFFRDHGFDDARRGVQYKGGGDSPDVAGLPGFHVECKRVEKGNLYDWLDQATQDAAPGDTPLVCHRRNHRTWVAILPLTTLLRMINENSQ